MKKYIPADKLIAEIERLGRNWDGVQELQPASLFQADLYELLSIITSLQQEQPDNMIQWTGNNLKEVIDFTGKSPKFGEWFKSWDEYESYVHSHGDILKLFSEDGSHFEVPVGAWIVKTPDGYNVPSVAKYIQQEKPKVDLEKELIQWHEHHFKKTGTYERHSGFYLENSSQLDIARHFYKLGLNARKEE